MIVGTPPANSLLAARKRRLSYRPETRIQQMNQAIRISKRDLELEWLVKSGTKLAAAERRQEGGSQAACALWLHREKGWQHLGVYARGM